jgi:hypothetical protein
MSVPVQNPMQTVLAARAAQTQQRPAVSLVEMKPSAPAPAPPKVTAAVVASGTGIVEIYAQFKGAVERHRFSIVEMAFYGRRLKAAEDWEALGFRDEEHFRNHHGLSEQRWRDCLTLGERLGQLTLEQARELTVEAARYLTKIHPRIWEEYSWLDEARLLPPREFGMLVEQRNHESAPTRLAEPRANVMVQVPVSQRNAIERRLGSIRKYHSLPSAGAALDYSIRAAERERQVQSKLMGLEEELSKLARLWSPDVPWSVNLSESTAELEKRLTSGDSSSMSEAAALSQRLMGRILKSLEAVHEVLPEANQPTVDEDRRADIQD